MSKMVSLKCKKNHVEIEAEVTTPWPFTSDPEKRGLWCVIVYLAGGFGKTEPGAIEFKPDGTFVSYSVGDRISGMEFYANPENFTEPFKAFLRECIDVAMSHDCFIQKTSGREAV